MATQKLVIDRQKWLRGEGDSLSRLLRSSDGKMCCVGFFCLACGLTERDIRDKGWPDVGDSAIPKWLFHEFQDGTSSPSRHDLAGNNDGPDIGETERERLIAADFAKNGVEVEFIN